MWKKIGEHFGNHISVRMVYTIWQDRAIMVHKDEGIPSSPLRTHGYTIWDTAFPSSGGPGRSARQPSPRAGPIALSDHHLKMEYVVDRLQVSQENKQARSADRVLTGNAYATSNGQNAQRFVPWIECLQ